MNLNIFKFTSPFFKGRREDRNTVQQLRQNNDYSLTDNNQIKINNAIENLSKETGENNIKFLIDVAENLQYGTNIDLGKEPEQDWKRKLYTAANQSLAISDPIIQAKYSSIIQKSMIAGKKLTEDEMNILKTRESILSRLDMSQLEDEANPNIKRVQSNIDYFIVSSSTPIRQKKYILNRLDYMLSPEYKINPQLSDKKTKLFAEIMNDLVVDTKESIVPNTKAINQKHHGMCAAISIARKMLSYEDKVNYVDNILSELDDSPNLMVYDTTQIGKHVKVPIRKVDVDFDEAEKKGYRIVDASTTQWMNVAQMYGADNTSKYIYIPFDKLGANSDSLYMIPMENDDYIDKHKYFQSLVKAKNLIGNAKKSKLKKQLKSQDCRLELNQNLTYVGKVNNNIKSTLKDIIFDMSEDELHSTISTLLSLQSSTSEKLNKNNDGLNQYRFIPNEESKMKDKKVEKFLLDKYNDRVDKNSLSENITNIRELIEESLNVSNKINPTNSQNKKLSDARILYDAAASYRNCVLKSLGDVAYAADLMVKNNMPDSETLVSKNIEDVINHIDKTGDKRYVDHFTTIFGEAPNDKDAVLQDLSELKEGIDSILTQGLDSLYYSLGYVDRKHALLGDVIQAKVDINNGNKYKLEKLSLSLGLKKPDKTKVLKHLDDFTNTLENNASDKEYIDIYNRMGYKNQLYSFKEKFSKVIAGLSNLDDEHNVKMIENLKLANGLPEDISQEQLQAIFETISDMYNQLASSITNTKQIMNISDDTNLSLINTAYESGAIILKMEKDGDLIPIQQLITLKEHLDKVDKLRSQDEFAGHHGKLTDPSLYKFSEDEEKTLKDISKSINKMYNNVNKELAFVHYGIREPLEEHIRKIGLDSGSYWVGSDGNSGLFSDQQVKILQQMTDRKYYVTEDAEKAVDVVKNTPYSIITGTSVFHDKVGKHAQYVAEISPVGEDNKDVLYHDNTWGVAENENTWVDSEGVTRTDYSDNRGGEQGYITNKKLRNGTYVEELIYKNGEVVVEPINNKQLKKLSGPKESFRFPALFDAIIPGDGGDINHVASGMKDNLFVPDIMFIDKFKQLAKTMTKDEIKSATKKNLLIRQNFLSMYKDNIKKRIIPNGMEKGITTKEQYDALSDNDPIKIYFEKVALYNSIPDCIDWIDFAKANTLEEINSFKAKRDDTARGYFNYSFAKEKEILKSFDLSSDNHMADIISDAAKKYNIELDKDKIKKITKDVTIYDPDEIEQFDGSLKTSINFVVNKTLKQFDLEVTESEDAQLAKQEIKENLTKNLSDALYFNESDINIKSVKANGISKYIDRKYNPETNADYVKIYRKLQDMTIEQFNEETSDVLPDELGIKETTGYESLKKFLACDSKTERCLQNLIYHHYLVKDMNLSDMTKSYKYNKLSKKLQGAKYTDNIRTFDDLYMDYSFSLQRLNYKKMFNKEKDDAYRKYGVFPAYPSLAIFDEEAFAKKFYVTSQFVHDRIQNIASFRKNQKLYEIKNNLGLVINSLPDDQIVPKSKLKLINHLSNQFITISAADDSIPESVNAANDIINLSDTAKGIEYKNVYKPMQEQIQELQDSCPDEKIEELKSIEYKYLKQNLKDLVSGNIPDKYKSRIKEDINRWINEELKYTKDSKVNNNLKKLSESIDKCSISKKNHLLTKNEFLSTLSSD